MDPSKYKDIVTSRGFKYHYYIHRPSTSATTILLLHGFPCTSNEWERQVPFFEGKGYSIVAPDLLGCGGTDKPTDPKEYAMNLMAKDVVELLDAEGVGKLVVVGHDWGSGLTTRLAIDFPERFYAVGFLAIGYHTPTPDFNLDSSLARAKAAFGSELLGYWKLFIRDDADDIMRGNIDALFALIYPHDPYMWKKYICPTGGIEAYIAEGRKDPIASYLTEREIQVRKEEFKKGGFTAPTCWYKAIVDNVAADADAALTPEQRIIKAPVFLGAAHLDFVGIAMIQKMNTSQHCPNATIVDFTDADHWILLSHAQKVNEELESWLGKLGITAGGLNAETKL